jgi:uncharacterized pyridoxamine 5'-phosphate oxidase family protein
MKIPESVIQFLENQGCVIVSTIDRKGFAHSSCKGIVKISSSGEIYLLDVYHAETYKNLMRNPRVSITAINEHKFSGYCLKGRAKLLGEEKMPPEMIKAWEDRITSRLTQRLLRNIHEEKGHASHPEISLPKPRYMIVMDVEDIVDLTPQHLK